MDVLDRIVVSDGESDSSVTLERAMGSDAEVARQLVDVDLQTFAESTFSDHTAQALARHGSVYLLRCEGKVIGTCVCLRDFTEPETALLLSMGLLPGYRGRGLGQWLVGGVLKALRDDGIRAVALHVGARNQRALKVYQDVGFYVVSSSGEVDDDRRLELRVDLDAERSDQVA